MTDIVARLRDYLGNGGFFNPELMDHAKVRDMVMDCRDEIERLRAELAAEREKAFTAMRVFERYRELEAQVAAAKAERDALRANLRDELERADAWHKTFLETQKHNDELRAQLDEAREALGPFVDWCVTCEVCNSELRDTVRVSAGITMGDLRRIRTVYEKVKGGGDE